MEPVTSKTAAAAARSGALAGLKAFRRELSRKRGDEAPLTTLGEIEEALDEAIDVLANQSEGLAGTIRTGLKALLIQPDLFSAGPPREWIVSHEAQESLKALAIAAIRGEDVAPHAARAKAHYDLFDKRGGASSAEDVIEEALDFILRSLDRDLSLGEKMIVGALANLRSEVERLAPPDTGALVDAEVERRLDRIRRARFFASSNTRAEAAAFGDALIDGNLRGASAKVRGVALAWCARFLAAAGEPGPERYLEAAEAILAHDCEVLTVARAFAAARTDFEQGLAILDPDASGLQATAAFQIMRIELSLGDAVDRAVKAGLDVSALDSDGRYVLLVSLIELRRWDQAMIAARQVGEEDFAATPALLWAVGTLLLASRTRDDLKPLVLQQVPTNPAEFLLGTDSGSLEALRLAGSLMSRAAAACEGIGLPTEAAAASRYVLWLKLRDPEAKADALEELRQNMSGTRQIALLPLALGFGLDVDVDEAERRIDRALARNPKPSAEIAGALIALLLHHAISDPERGLEFLAERRELFELFIDRQSSLGLEAKMLIEAGRQEEAQSLVEAHGEEFPSHLKTLIRSSTGEENKDASMEALESAYADQSDTQRLLALIFAYLKRDNADRVTELARTLLADVPDTDVASEVIRHLAEKGHDAHAIELLELLGDGASHSTALMAIASWLYFRVGRFAESEQALQAVEAVRDEESDRRLRYQLLIATGRWEEVDEFIEQQWRKRERLSASELGQLAMVSAHAATKRTVELAKAAAEKDPENPQVLIAAYSALTTAGQEDEHPETGRWLIEAAAHSGEDGPVRSASLQELVDGAPAWNKRVDDATLGLAAGTVPLDLVGRLVNRPWLELHLAALLGNARVADARRRRIVPLFSGRKSEFRNRPLEETDACFDTNALVTLAALDALDPVLGSFETIHVRHDALTDLYLQQTKVSFHQPSRIAFAHRLVELVARKKVLLFETAQVPPISLVTDLGQDRAEMLFDASTTSGEGQHLFVHPYPMTRAGSLLNEAVPLDEYRDQLVSCSAVIDALSRFGRLRGEEADAANAYLSLHEQRWPNEPRIAKGATLYLSDLAVAYLRYTRMLDRIVDAGLIPIVPASELREAEALLELEATSADVEAVLGKVRATVAKYASQGRVRFGPIGGGEEDGSNEAIGELVVRSRLLVTDERFLNRFENFDHEQGRTRISSSIDLLSQLAAAGRFDRGRLDEIRTRLRSAGAIYVPLERDELARRIADSSLAGEDGNVEIVETGELRAIRENIRLAQARGWFDPAIDIIWLTQTHLALSETLMEQWTADASDQLSAARSNWLLALIDLQHWADSVVNRHLDLAAYGRILDISKLVAVAPQLPDQPRERLNRWLERELIAPFLEREPRSRPALLNHLRSLIRAVSFDVARTPPKVSERVAGRSWFDSFAKPIQLGMLENKEFADWIGYSLQSNIQVEDSRFLLSDFAQAVRTLYDGREVVQSIKDSEGRSWDLATDPADGQALILRSGELEYHTPAIPGLLPNAKERLKAFDERLRAKGVNPHALDEWRVKLKSAVVNADDIAAIDAAIRIFPPFAAGVIAEALRAGAEPEKLAPRESLYYERLVGTADAAELQQFLKDPGRLAIDWAGGPAADRAAWLLLRASQPEVLTDSELTAMEAKDRRKLASWLAGNDDLFSKVAFIELALPHAHEDARLEKSILKMVADIAALDPRDETGTLHLLSGLIVFIDGELSHQGTLGGWPPFRRRQAAIAQASLITRVLGDEANTRGLANFCAARGGWRFAVQSLMDLRVEPRWQPDQIAAEQLKYEAIARVANASARLGDEQLTEGLRTCFRDEGNAFRQAFGIQMFFPGPLEGGSGNLLHELPGELLEAIEAGLDSLPLTFEALNPLLNCNNMFKFPAALLERVIGRVQEAGPRLFGKLEGGQIGAYLLALASLAAAERLTALADTVQVLARHHRARAKVPVEDEMRLAMTAAASLEDEQAWREKIGLWTLELASNVERKDEAESLLQWLDTMGEIDPHLRAYTGRARANLCLLLEC